MRRPTGDHGVGSASEMRERHGRLVAVTSERIDAQVDRRTAGERRALRRALVAEHRGEFLVEPFRIVAAHMGRRVVEPR